MRILTPVLFLVVCMAFPSDAAETTTPLRPNLLFIMSDDHAAHAIRAYGSAGNLYFRK